MGFFGGDHTDEMDLAAGLSAMVVGSHLPEDYEAGRFHLLSLGVYVDLGKIHVVYFSGRLRHSGTPPLAPPVTGQGSSRGGHHTFQINHSTMQRTIQGNHPSNAV